jgi:hypothetical protein
LAQENFYKGNILIGPTQKSLEGTLILTIAYIINVLVHYLMLNLIPFPCHNALLMTDVIFLPYHWNAIQSKVHVWVHKNGVEFQEDFDSCLSHPSLTPRTADPLLQSVSDGVKRRFWLVKTPVTYIARNCYIRDIWSVDSNDVENCVSLRVISCHRICADWPIGIVVITIFTGFSHPIREDTFCYR